MIFYARLIVVSLVTILTSGQLRAEDCKEAVKDSYLAYEDGRGKFATAARSFRKDNSGERWDAFCGTLASAMSKMQDYARAIESCTHTASDGGESSDKFLSMLHKEISQYQSMGRTQGCPD